MEPSTEPNLDILNALFIQLTEGCGSIHCRCIHCFSSKSFVHKNKNPEEIIKWMKSNTKYMCSSICPALYKRKIVKNSYNFEKFIKSKMFFGNISRFVSYIDSKEKFCSLFWGLSTFSKKNYNFDEKFICSFINDTQNLKSKLLTDVIKQRVIDICISDYSHYNQRGLFVFFAFSHLLTYSQFIVMFLRIVKFVQKGPRNLVHDLYYRVSGGVMSLPTLEVKSIHYIYK
ncbi:hypothetical protein TRFO_28908 [Tritrichomonas foetus]|uniref:Ubiquitin-protein ligase E3A N-terminal zinc-binding domain-containing protein n=1 Tax=Tritrichomonas foetus TaxID=1144522 RepID=A0A1J4JWX2_9EUKA|nr:hypothetical protein TRFO_28908 [Tritrichomonas foetus]|eukprot:OHT03649.1 hypothetical protein TRFO_28908 [Tritrichomonas foetus]